jgi:predicted esterase
MTWPRTPALFRGAALTLAVGREDRYMTEARARGEEQRLREAGMELRVLQYDGGHRVEPDALRELVRLGV